MFLNLAMRYPPFPHETGVDSFFIHTLAESISSQGQAKWVLNPLSFFGLYPLSYPSVGPFLYAASSEMSGFSIEAVILLTSFVLGAASVPLSFMMARALRRDDIFALGVAFCFSLAPRFLTFTMWTGSTRGLFMFLLPVFVWGLLSAYRTTTKTYVALTVLMLGLAATTHRLAVLLVLILVAFVLTYIIVLVLRVLRLRSPRLMLNPTLRKYASVLSLAVIAVIAAGILFGTDVLEEYQTSRLTSGQSTAEQLIALGGSIGRSVGLALPLALVGVAYLPFLRNKGLPEVLVLLILLAMVPTLFLRRYTGFYITPFIALFGGLGILLLVRALASRPKAAAVALVTALVLVTGTSLYARDWELGQVSFIADDTYVMGVYVRHLPGDATTLANDGLIGVHVAAFSSKPYLPVGGAGTTFQSPELLAFGFYSGQDVVNQTVRIPLQNLTIESDSPFLLYGIQAEQDWALLLQDRTYGGARTTDRERYDLAYYLEAEYLDLNFTAYDNRYPSTFAVSVKQGYVDSLNVRHDARYKLFDSGIETLWLVYPQKAFR
ncbi:MAG TPA: hypothetical protein VJ397_05670 [Thermoplasmata archaeon]|nr:hypothetical protein [Thermoplasmata archaeon]